MANRSTSVSRTSSTTTVAPAAPGDESYDDGVREGPRTVDEMSVLEYTQVCRLHHVMYDELHINPNPRVSPHFPTLNIQMYALVKTVRRKLTDLGVLVRDIRLNGGAASYVLGNDVEPVYNDFDLIFGVDLGGDDGADRVKLAVQQTLFEFFTDGGDPDDPRERPSVSAMEDVYVNKMVRVANDIDRWSLFSLSNSSGYDVELKFVDRMRRQYEFSVDSFQIVLDNLLLFYTVMKPTMSAECYPRIAAESVCGPFATALSHLNRKLIDTDRPEQIRGGGLLKYCHLIARGYHPANGFDYASMEKYMCSRFFIDFSSVDSQVSKLHAYLAAHFIASRQTANDSTKFEFLRTLYIVVEQSTVCLMGQERFQTLGMIDALARHAHYELGFNNSAGAPTWRMMKRCRNGGGQQQHQHTHGGAQQYPHHRFYSSHRPPQYGASAAGADCAQHFTQFMPYVKCAPQSFYILS